MEQFSYSFITTMMHSTWQTALFLLCYYLLVMLHGNPSPLFKRNFLYLVIGLQLFTSFFTFGLIYSQSSFLLLRQFAFSFGGALQQSWMADNALLLFSAYALIVLWRLANSFFPWNHFKKSYQKSLVKPGIDIRLFTQTKAYQFGIRQKVAIWCSSAITTPMTFGFWKPIILLPMALVNQLSIRETEALIIHELTHIRYLDYLYNWLLVIAETIFFFNPFIHIVARKIRIEREKNCDVQVLMFNYGEVQYAETLLKTAKLQQQVLTLQLGAVVRKGQLLNRIHFFSNKNNLEFRRSGHALSSGGLIAALLINLALVLLFMTVPILKSRPVDFSAENAQFNMPPALESGKRVVSNANPGGSVVVKASAKPISVAVLSAAPAYSALSSGAENDVIVDGLEPVYAMPAASTTSAIYEGKEVMIKEESSDGKKITAVYQIVLIEGIWTLQPLWMLSETKTFAGDSLKQALKDSVISIYPVVQ